MSLALVVGQEIADRYLRARKTVKKIFSNISFANLGGGKLARPIERISLCHASFDIETAHRRQVKLEISLEFRKQSAIELNWRDKIGSGKVAATIAATERERKGKKEREDCRKSGNPRGGDFSTYPHGSSTIFVLDVADRVDL